MSETLVNWFTTNLEGLPRELIIFIISMVPILELRGGILAASLLRIPVAKAIPICLAGNILPIPFILLFIKPIFRWMKGTKLFKPMVEKIESKSLAKSGKIQKYEFLGLLLFVGIAASVELGSDLVLHAFPKTCRQIALHGSRVC